MVEPEMKRGRGRPKGSLGKKALAREIEIPVPTIPEEIIEPSEQEQVEQVEEPKVEPEEEPEVEPETPAPKRRPRKPVNKPPPMIETPPVRRTKNTEIVTPKEQPLTYLEVLTRAISAAKQTDRQDRINRYDAFFSNR